MTAAAYTRWLVRSVFAELGRRPRDDGPAGVREPRRAILPAGTAGAR